MELFIQIKGERFPVAATFDIDSGSFICAMTHPLFTSVQVATAQTLDAAIKALAATFAQQPILGKLKAKGASGATGVRGASGAGPAKLG